MTATLAPLTIGWNDPSVKNSPVIPMEFSPYSRSTFITAPESLSIFSFLFSPMILLSAFSLVLVLVMPKLMENLDPEELKEMQRSQANANALLSGTSDLSNRLSNALAGRRQ